jgi:hypothetical protein
MSNPLIRIHNLETDEVVDREMTDEEFAQWQAQEAEWLANHPIEESK